jgi:hypothetical protein
LSCFQAAIKCKVATPTHPFLIKIGSATRVHTTYLRLNKHCNMVRDTVRCDAERAGILKFLHPEYPEYVVPKYDYDFDKFTLTETIYVHWYCETPEDIPGGLLTALGDKEPQLPARYVAAMDWHAEQRMIRYWKVSGDALDELEVLGPRARMTPSQERDCDLVMGTIRDDAVRLADEAMPRPADASA